MQHVNAILKRVFLALLISFSFGSIFCQTTRNIFIGIQPSITVEPFYEKGELDINVFPLIIEFPIGMRTNIKLSPIVNYHTGGQEKGISDLGMYGVMPIYFNKRESTAAKSYGFYIGPVLGFGRNVLNEHFTTTLAIEPGYMFEAKKKFTIAIGMQFGASYFAYSTEPSKWYSHWGPKVSFGFWLDE